MIVTPQPFRWTGTEMVPLRPRLADRQYVIGEEYSLVPHEDRSPASHRHFFAAVNEAWKSLPEDMADSFPTPDHLRKYALIRAGYRDERTIVASSRAEALRIAAFVKPMDEYALVSTAGSTVVVLTAKSQSERAMGRADFQASKDAVLTILADMLGVEPATLAKQTEAAA
jgi:hypothetical protein